MQQPRFEPVISKRVCCFLYMLLCMSIVLIAACAAITGTPSPLTKEQQFIQSAKSFYISQYKDYEYMTADPSKLTEEQKVILRKKKEVLVQVKPLIDAYSALVDSGQKPTLAQEQQIMQLLNSIGGNFQ